MKTLTKILSVTAVVVLCVCLFTLTAFAADKTVSAVGQAKAGTCSNIGNLAYVRVGDDYYVVADPSIYKAGQTYDDTVYTELDDANAGGQSIIYAGCTTDPTNHTSLHKVLPAEDSCTVPGHDAYWKCDACGNMYASESDAWSNTDPTTDPTTFDHATPPGHTFGTPVPYNPPSCTHDGNVNYEVCTKCGAIYDLTNGVFLANIEATKLPKLGHIWGPWEILKEATNVSPGQKKRTCTQCPEVEYEEIPALGIYDAPYEDLWYVIPDHDAWLRGEEPLSFDSNLVKKLNAEGLPLNANFVGVRIGTDSLYENSYDTFDFWSWDRYIMLGEKTMQGLREGKYRIWVYDKRNPKQYTTSCEFWVVDVPTLEPYSTDKHVINSSKSLRFIASEEIDPNSIMVGSKKLYDAADYFVSNDRMSITLSADFLNNRQTGTYTISAVTKGGRTVKANFYILTTAQASSSPRTGDESQIGLWAAFLLLSGAAVVVLVPKLRKQGVK